MNKSIEHTSLTYPNTQSHQLPPRCINHLPLSSMEIAQLMGFPQDHLNPAHKARLLRRPDHLTEHDLKPQERPDAP